MQLEQQETFEITGPQLEVLGRAESKLPAPARKKPAAALFWRRWRSSRCSASAG